LVEPDRLMSEDAKVTDGESAIRDRSDRECLTELAPGECRRIGDGTGSGSLAGTPPPMLATAASSVRSGGTNGRSCRMLPCS
jgi:hypothetical protein